MLTEKMLQRLFSS